MAATGSALEAAVTPAAVRPAASVQAEAVPSVTASPVRASPAATAPALVVPTGTAVATQPETQRPASVPGRTAASRIDDPGKSPVMPGKTSPLQVSDPKKSKGVLGEMAVPFSLYSGWDWNVIGGGEETASSRPSLARKTRYSPEPSAGIDAIVENVKTDRLVNVEQKAVGASRFDKATATTVNLEKNLTRAIDVLQARIDSGAVHPEEVARLQRTVDRLRATFEAAMRRGTLPEGVVFELTNIGGQGRNIGKDYIAQLAKRYGNDPDFIDHLLDRTFVRDPQLAREMGRDPSGVRGTDSDPDIVPARELLTKDAQDELDRLRARKSPEEWKAQKQAGQARRKAESDARKQAEREAKAAQRKAGQEAKAVRQKAEREQRAAERQRERDAKAARKQAEKEARDAQRRQKRETKQRDGQNTGAPRPPRTRKKPAKP
ncbi:MAG: hypothetical protein JSR21_07060 [Proteobacteria bacterium]|nr:hypothetical protein [Pseudomonadota bacterium]